MWVLILMVYKNIEFCILCILNVLNARQVAGQQQNYDRRRACSSHACRGQPAQIGPGGGGVEGLHEASASHQNELMQEQSKRRAAEEALKQIVGDVDNLKAGSSMQMQKVGAELERLQQDNMHQMQALQRECNDAKDSLASANTALQAERQARIMAEQGMKDAWTMMTDLKAQLNKQQMDLQHELAQQPTDEVFVRLPQCKFMYSYGILL